MRKLWLASSFLAVAAAAVVVFATTREASAAALNETGVADEADFCMIQGAPPPLMAAGGSVQLFGRIFEAGMSDVSGENPSILADVGVGPLGSDPRTDGGWTYTPAAYNLDVGNDDEYMSTVTLPSPSETTTYSFVYRFSLDGGEDHTYCDTDGAGSNTGLDYDPGENGVVTVEGTGGGGGEGDADGDVTTSVDVISDPGACIILSTSVVNYGALTFSTQNAAQSGNNGVTITSCSLTTSLDLLAKGTDATGLTAAWTLTPAPPSDNMCDTGNNGVDEFSQRANGVSLSLSNQTISTGLGQGGELFTPLSISMPCIGSSGTGETVSSSITFTAIPGSAFVDADLDGFDASEDCDDTDFNVNPAAPEVIGDGIDNDCDGVADEGGVQDNDNDTFPLPQDCDDTDANIFPGAAEIEGDGLDNNCDGAGDDVNTNDNDADGFTASQGDCNDNNAAISPGATEVIGDRVDNDCDGQADEST